MHFEIWWPFAFVLGLVAIKSLTRIVTAVIERRKSAPPQALTDIATKIERINQAVEAMAIEVERVGESQRFLTRVLSERSTASVGSGAERI
jgi:predicted  nucleic acid-binding Zn-ribbon protein